MASRPLTGFLTYLTTRQLGPKAVAVYISAVQRFIREYGITAESQITVAMLREHYNSLSLYCRPQFAVSWRHFRRYARAQDIHLPGFAGGEVGRSIVQYGVLAEHLPIVVRAAALKAKTLVSMKLSHVTPRPDLVIGEAVGFYDLYIGNHEVRGIPFEIGVTHIIPIIEWGHPDTPKEQWAKSELPFVPIAPGSAKPITVDLVRALMRGATLPA